jgi:hypothetical protein
LAAIASAAGLLLPDLYRETDWVIPQNRGQDFVTLAVVVPILTIAISQASKGSRRMFLVWFGLMGYLWYTYVAAAFSYRMNTMFLVYVALFALTTFTLVLQLLVLRDLRIAEVFSRSAPRKPVAAFLLLLGILLCSLWLPPVFLFMQSGTLPEFVVKAQTPTSFVYVLDLGIVVPVSIVAAFRIWNASDEGFALAGFVLGKAAAMGLALVSMTGFALAAKLEVDPMLSIIWIAVFLSASVMWVWLLSKAKD